MDGLTTMADGESEVCLNPRGGRRVERAVWKRDACGLGTVCAGVERGATMFS
jgi:hypothetical protein